MAVVITPFPHQEIEIGRPFSLDIDVSGSPENVLVSGRIRGFSYHWTGTQIQLSVTPEVLVDNLEVTITADDETYTGTISIVPVRPAIANLPRQIVSRGQEIVIPIPITGHVSRWVVDGPWIGLKDRLTETGGELYGIIDASANFTARTFEFTIVAYNGNVFDTATLIVEIAVGG